MLEDPVSPVVWVVLDEAVLRRVVGGPDIMAEQIKHLVRSVERRRVRVHVMPFDVGSHQPLQGNLVLMEFEDQPPVAYSEGVHVGALHDSPSVVRRLQGAYALALSDALSLRKSLAMLKATAKDYGRP
ncbi:hypothetical protein GCM10010129_12930 [Streptomyces fumigatiscleroticus]|nr:hypothetical protein GCM10010129_12930 [Streptomyces fumigatiscleroticus]